MKKTIIYVLIALLAIMLGVITGINLNDEEKVKEVSGGNAINTSNRNESVISDTQNNIENNVVEDVIENEEEEEKEEPKTDLDKAKELVKQAWGKDDNSVYFSQDSIDGDGYYIICVRDKATTSALAWYQVNVEAEVCVELIDW